MPLIHVDETEEAVHERLTRRLCWALRRKQAGRAERLEARLREIEDRLSDHHFPVTS